MFCLSFDCKAIKKKKKKGGGGGGSCQYLSWLIDSFSPLRELGSSSVLPSRFGCVTSVRGEKLDEMWPGCRCYIPHQVAITCWWRACKLSAETWSACPSCLSAFRASDSMVADSGWSHSAFNFNALSRFTPLSPTAVGYRFTFFFLFFLLFLSDVF